MDMAGISASGAVQSDLGVLKKALDSDKQQVAQLMQALPPLPPPPDPAGVKGTQVDRIL